MRVASGYDDPFRPGVQALARALPAGAVVELAKGCHTGAFFAEQQPPSLAFLDRHLAGLRRGGGPPARGGVWCGWNLPAARHRAHSRITGTSYGEDPGFGEDRVHPDAPNTPGNPDPPR